jgi:DNA-binding transcriptional MocR family regulator
VRIAGVDEGPLVARARRAGVVLKSTLPHYLVGPPGGEFVFGFAEHTPATIDEGVARLARALRTA